MYVYIFFPRDNDISEPIPQIYSMNPIYPPLTKDIKYPYVCGLTVLYLVFMKDKEGLLYIIGPYHTH